MYQIPEEYYFRIHHVRPRFKNDIENVLLYIAESLSRINSAPKKDFIQEINNAIYQYPGNAHRKLKTINNWRTEISALFGFIEVDENNIYYASTRAKELAQKQDLVECFKIFLYNFQYPGAHIKPKATLEQIENGVHFKPAQYILKLLKFANKDMNKPIGLTKYEICHCIFNDLRVTRDSEDVELTWKRILNNRNNNVTYDRTGDIIRYAGDIVDYMEIANLLKTYDGNTYYLNDLEEENIRRFCESTEWFNGYDDMIKQRKGTIENVKECISPWFAYVNRDMSDTDFSTDIISFISKDNQEYNQLKKNNDDLLQKIQSTETIVNERIDNENLTTKDIGDIGEHLVHGHECMRIKNGGRPDLIHLIKIIPSSFAVGDDINSIELDERKRYIEVKTTISSKPLVFQQLHMTKNEWNTANTLRDRYYIYRLMLSRHNRVLFLLQDPVGLYKKDKLDMVPNDGVDIKFNKNKVGQFEDLLTWEN